MMRILCISPFFPPIRDSEAFCGGKMVLALRAQGADVSVLFLDAPYLEGKRDGSQIWAGIRSVSLAVNQGKPNRFFAAWCALRYRVSGWPRWIDSVVNEARQQHRRKPFDIVYSRSLPMFAHVAGYWASKQLGIPWLSNINDPWDEHLFPGFQKPVSALQKRLSHYWLEKTFADSELVTFPSRRLADFITRFASKKPQVEILPHIGTTGPARKRDRGFWLVHAGKLGCNEITGRSTRTLLLALKEFLNRLPEAAKQTQLVLVGPEDRDAKSIVDGLGLNENVISAGQVSYEQSLTYIGAASACVLIEGKIDEGIYLPSKLADYIVADKPTIALSPGKGAVADLAVEKGIFRIDQDDQNQTQEVVRTLYDAYATGKLAEVSPSRALVAMFQGETVAKKFLQLASQIIGGRPPTRLAATITVPSGYSGRQFAVESASHRQEPNVEKG